MKRILLISLLLTLTGCASLGGDGAALGTHQINVDENAAVTINTRTIHGAPDVEVVRADGTRVIIRSGNTNEQLKAVLEALQ